MPKTKQMPVASVTPNMGMAPGAGTAGSAGVVELPTTAPAPETGAKVIRRGTASSTGRLGQIVTAANRWRENYNPARGLTIRRAVELLELGQRGDTAYLQWAFRTIERRYPTLSALITRCEAPLLNFGWEIKVKEKLPVTNPGDEAELERLQGVAEKQKASLAQAYDGLDNLKEAIQHMHLAEFRGYAHLQKHRNEDGSVYHLEPLNQWCVCRDGLEGNWFWNPDSRSTSAPLQFLGQKFAIGGESLPAEDFIVYEVPRPIDEIALVLFIRSNLAEKDADGFLEIYGIPGGVVIMPPNVPQGKESEYEAAAKSVAEGGSGALPNGADYKANDGPRGVDPFSPRLKHLQEELVLAGTGGKLTMLAESGSGTLAGGAHEDAFEEIAIGRANRICEQFQRDFDGEVLERKHPEEPKLVYFQIVSAESGDESSLAFTRDMVKALLRNPQMGPVVIGQLDLKETLRASGVVINEEARDARGEIEQIKKAALAPATKPGADANDPVFDPEKDIVTQRALWREAHKGQSASDMPATLKNRWVTIAGRAVNLGDDDGKSLSSGRQTDRLKGQNGPESKGNDVGRSVKGSVESAAHDTGRDAETSPGHDATGAERAQRIAIEQQRLKEWAATNGKLKGKLPRADTQGAEHTVQIDEESQRVIKATRPESGTGYGIAFGSYSQGATPSEYLDRIATHNREFGDDVRLERVVPSGGKLSIVTSQPFIKGRDATQGEIDSMMEGKGYEAVGEGTYYHGGKGLMVHDLVPKNAKVSERGIVHPIDPVIQRVTPDFAMDLKRNPISPIKNRASVGDDELSLEDGGQRLVVEALQSEFEGLNARLAAIAEIEDPDTQKRKLAGVLADLDKFEADLARDPAVAQAIYKVLAAGLGNGIADSQLPIAKL